MVIKVQKGTKDILPSEVSTWQYMEEKAREVFGLSNYKEIRTPIFESTELFARGVGDSTDIVNKEMYTFEKSGRSLTLRPENTASVVRSYIENGFSRLSVPVKLWYKGPMFRYERPQAGRQRQFHQIGVECFGVKEPACDAEVISLAINYLKALGLNDLTVEINSLGCNSCRLEYRNKIKNILNPYLSRLCSDCNIRYEKNPLRILDCKVDSCIEIMENKEIRNIIEESFICNECLDHFEKLKKYLDVLDIKYTVNRKLVRGLDYYNRTVFEIKSNNLGSQNAVCGGGRYDSLVETLNGPSTAAVGFAMGLERLYYLIEKREDKKLDFYIISGNTIEALRFVNEIRNKGFSADFDYTCKKFTKQLEKASKVSRYALILEEDEIKNNTITIKNLASGDQKTILQDKFLNNISSILEE